MQRKSVNRSRQFLLFPLAAFIMASSGFPVGQAAEEESPSPEQVFEQRIMPIFRSPKPSSCIQCHLASVDLKDYIRPSAQETFANLRSQGLVDVAEPQHSKILSLITMGEKDLDRGAQLLHRKTRQAEYEAFESWLVACCADAEYLAATAKIEPDTSLAPDSVVRHSRKDRVLDSFERHIWSQRMRCFPCHTPSEIDSANPKQAQAAERHKELVATYGQRMNIFKATPLETMKGLIATSRRNQEHELPLVNVQDPRNSLLILKPTAKLPGKGPDGKLLKASSVDPVTHGGGLKMHVDDFSYKAFLRWIEDYAVIATGGYASADQLPADDWIPTQHVVRITQTPEAWPKLATVQILVHDWDTAKGAWSADPVAFTQTKIGPRAMAMGSVFLIRTEADANPRELIKHEAAYASQAAAEPARAEPKLPAGKYQLRVCIDHHGVLAKDPTAMLDPADCVGIADVDAVWQAGGKNALVVPGDAFTLSQ